MKLIIDIDEKTYEALKRNKQIIESENISNTNGIKAQRAILNGTPLPKGHGRLIDADAILEEPFGNTYKDIDIAETIIEADKAESEG